MNPGNDKTIKYIFINTNNTEQTEKLLHDAILNYILNSKKINDEINK